MHIVIRPLDPLIRCGSTLVVGTSSGAGEVILVRTG